MVSGAPTVDEATERYAGKFLTPIGIAPWQTPFIQIGGDLAYSVGSCETDLTPAEAETYLAPLYEPGRFPPGVDEKAKKYFAWKRDGARKLATADGLGATAHGYSPARCSALLTGLSGLLKTAANK